MALGRKPIEIVEEGKHQLLVKANHWNRIYLKEVAKVQNGFAFSSSHFSKDEGVPLIRIRDIDKETTVDNYKGKYSEEYLVYKGDILIGMDGDFKASKWKGKPALLNQRVCRIVPKLGIFDKDFLFICLQPYLDAIHAETSSVTVKHLSSRTIEEIPLPYPPLDEQQEIVAKIEELFSELDKGKEQLETARQQLKVYRQAVLKWAFEGKFTNAEVEDGELPERWRWVKLGELMESVRNGYSKKPDTEGSFKILRISSVRPGKVDISDTRFLLSEIGEENSVKENDLLFTRYNGSIEYVGVCGRIPNLKEKLYYPDKLIRCRPINKYQFHSAYLEYASNSGRAREFVLSRIKTTAGQTGIAGSEIKQIPIPLAPLEEQQIIVQAVESRLSVCDNVEETITQSLQQAETLRQSILKQAFEGKLIKPVGSTLSSEISQLKGKAKKAGQYQISFK